MGHWMYTTVQMRAHPRQHKYTIRQKRFLTAIGACHVGAFLVFMPAVAKIGVALYQIIYSSGTTPLSAPPLTQPFLNADRNARARDRTAAGVKQACCRHPSRPPKPFYGRGGLLSVPLYWEQDASGLQRCMG
jgi:hypothetical protein